MRLATCFGGSLHIRSDLFVYPKVINPPELLDHSGCKAEGKQCCLLGGTTDAPREALLLPLLR